MSRGGHTREVSGALRAVAACSLRRVKAQRPQGIVFGGGLRRLLFHRIDSLNEEIGHAAVPVFRLGVGRIGEAVYKEDSPVCMLESRGKAGLLVTVYYIPTSVG